LFEINCDPIQVAHKMSLTDMPVIIQSIGLATWFFPTGGTP
jgi:hypothetical protein